MLTERMRFVVATHGHCFDGLASAAVFTRLARANGAEKAEFSYRTCGYGAGQTRADESVLVGDENAILDYRYSPSPKLTWYFDHHRTAFQNEQDRENFENRAKTERFFYDAGESSCTKLICDIGESRFGMKRSGLEELVQWADTVDSARFESAEQAVNRSDPVMQLVSVVEHYGDDALFSQLIPELLEKPLGEVARSKMVTNRYRPLGKKHDRFVERVRENSEFVGRVVFVDLTQSVLETVGKFVTYALYPNYVYSVMIGLLKNGPKISVGYNPWSGKPLDADISAICARYGGGGHPVVGAISFTLHELDKARSIARAIADELSG